MFGIEEMSGKNLDFLKDLNLHLVNTPEKMTTAFQELQEVVDKDIPLALDTETEGLSPLHHNICGVVISPDEKTSYYFPLRHKIGDNLNEVDFILAFKKLCEKANYILFNAKFDWKMIYHHWKIDFNIIGDAQLQAYLINSDLSETKGYSLKDIARAELGIDPLEMEDLGTHNFTLTDPEESYKYACPDTTNTYALWNRFKEKIKELKLEAVEKVELSCIKPVGEMELNGITLDTAKLKAQEQAMVDRLKELESQIYSYAGREFDLNSPQQMAEVLYDDLKLPMQKVKDRATGEMKDDRSVGVDNLKRMIRNHPIISAIQSYRGIFKLYNDFIIKLPSSISEDGRLHGSFNQDGTRSGRFSASGGFGKYGEKIKVNLQQLPKGKGFEEETFAFIPPEKEHLFDWDKEYTEKEIKDLYPEYEKNKEGRKLNYIKYIPVGIRNALIPSPGYTWVSIDFSQLEYRMLANLSGEQYLIDSFKQGIDFHTATAASMFQVPVDKVDSSLRKKGKTINFGIIYGLTDFGLADKLGCDVAEAGKLKKQYFANLPVAEKYIETIKDTAFKLGYVRTLLGRIRWFKEQFARLDNDRKRCEQTLKAAFNTVVQGSGADISKLALARTYEVGKKYGDKVRMLSMVHDEINWEVSNELNLQQVCSELMEAMTFREIKPGWATIMGDLEIGENYGDLHAPDFELLPVDAFGKVDVQEIKDVPTSNTTSSSSTSSKQEAPKSQEKKSKPVQEPQEVKYDLETIKFKIPTVLVEIKDEFLPKHESALTSFIENNFGKNQLILKIRDTFYKFGDDVRVSDNIDCLTESFDFVKVYKEKISIKL